jgi:hypothetical protein
VRRGGRGGFDPGAELWRELDRAADDLLADVAALARAYGWTQAEALGLSPVRRARYMALAR